MSSLARLQHTGGSGPVKGKDRLERSPSGDSDKENWMAGYNGGQPRRKLPASRIEKQSSSKSVLGDDFNVPAHALNLGGSRE